MESQTRLARRLEADLSQLRHDLDDIKGDGGHAALALAPAPDARRERPRHTWHGDLGGGHHGRRDTYYERGSAFADWRPAHHPRLGHRPATTFYDMATPSRTYVNVGPEFNPTTPALREWWHAITNDPGRPIVLNLSADRYAR